MTDCPELSIVMPCLNEEDTIGICIEKANKVMLDSGIDGEVVVADNGSKDQSQIIAKKLGARIIHVEERGYGAALMGGIENSRGRFVIMGDCDDSYDFLEIEKFVNELRKGFDLVQGVGFPAVEVEYYQMQCHFYIVGLGIHFYHGSSEKCSAYLSMMFTVACVDSHVNYIIDLTLDHPGWNSLLK